MIKDLTSIPVAVRADPDAVARLIAAIQAVLTPDLLSPKYKGEAKNGPLSGHCAVAAEALWHMLGGFRSGTVPHWAPDGDGTHHWLVRKSDGERLDPTAGQYDGPPPYDKGVAFGYMTRCPSARAQCVIDRIANRLKRDSEPGILVIPALIRDSMASSRKSFDAKRYSGAKAFYGTCDLRP
ncbi:MAG: hypothetical protein U9N14_07350 [Pseudomonadota bacterium]|nr:hypothetical protein [Pseudomonadota bacterium]